MIELKRTAVGAAVDHIRPWALAAVIPQRAHQDIGAAVPVEIAYPGNAFPREISRRASRRHTVGAIPGRVSRRAIDPETLRRSQRPEIDITAPRTPVDHVRDTAVVPGARGADEHVGHAVPIDIARRRDRPAYGIPGRSPDPVANSARTRHVNHAAAPRAKDHKHRTAAIHAWAVAPRIADRVIRHAIPIDITQHRHRATHRRIRPRMTVNHPKISLRQHIDRRLGI